MFQNTYENNTPVIIEIDSTYRCRTLPGNSLPGEFIVYQVPRSTKTIDPVSYQAPCLFWRGANFMQNYITRPGFFDNENYLSVKLIHPSVIQNPLPDNELGFSTSLVTIYIQAELSDGSGNTSGDSPQNSLHVENNYYVGSIIAVIDSSGNINDRRRIRSYKYLENNNAVCTIDIAFNTATSYDSNGIVTFVILDPTDFHSINNPYIYCPRSPFISNFFSQSIDDVVLGATFEEIKPKTMIIYNHCNHQYRPIKLHSYNKESHVIQIDTSDKAKNCIGQGPIQVVDGSNNNWNPWDIYSIRYNPPKACGGLGYDKEKIDIFSNDISDFSNTNIPLFITNDNTMGTIYPPRRLDSLDALTSPPYNKVFNLVYNFNNNFIISKTSNTNNSADSLGGFLEILNLRCIDISGNDPVPVYEFSFTEYQHNSTSSLIDASFNLRFSEFEDFYTGCKLRFNVTDASGLPCFDSPFYGAIQEISSYDASGGGDYMKFEIQPGIYDPSFNSIGCNYSANIICAHDCEKYLPDEMRDIDILINVEGTFGPITTVGLENIYELNILKPSWQNVFANMSIDIALNLQNLYIQDTNRNNTEGNLSMIKNVRSIDTINHIIWVTLLAEDAGFGANTNTFSISSGKLKIPFKNKLSNQDYCLLETSDNFCTPISSWWSAINSLCTYEITLCNVVLPNIILDTYFGGKIAAYQYFYVQLNNYDGGANNTQQTLASNNKFKPPGIVFRVPVERQFVDETSKFFLSFRGDCSVYTRFDPTTTLSFSVQLPNGRIFRNILPEYYSPCFPNPLIQITASFKFRRIADTGRMKTDSSYYNNQHQHRQHQHRHGNFTTNLNYNTMDKPYYN